MKDESFFNNESPKKKNNNFELSQQKKEQRELINHILDENFNFTSWISNYLNFANKYKRIFYSDLSSSIIRDFDEDKITILLSNLSSVTEKISLDNSVDNQKFVENEQSSDETVLLSAENYRLMYKLYDHCNLAYVQRLAYKETKKTIQDHVDSSFDEKYKKEYDEKIKPKIDSFEKDISTQLITLVSIFTALSFVMFGGISVLDNLLQNVKVLPVMKVLFIGDLWLICMTNLFIVFVRLICIIINKEFKWILYTIILNIVLLILLLIIILFGKGTYGVLFYL